MKRAAVVPHLNHPVRVVWEDAVGNDAGWHDLEQALTKTCASITSIAHLIGVTNTALYLAMDRDGTEVHSTGIIPLAWVKSVERLVPE